MKRHLSLMSLLLSFVIVVAGQQAPPPTQQAAPPTQEKEREGEEEQERESQVTTQRSVAQDDRDNKRDDVVRITTNLVQIDVTVTDGNGRQVTDLTPEDFEVFEEGRPQKISNFSYVKPSEFQKTMGEPPPPATIALPGVASKKSGRAVMVAAPVPPVKLRPEQVRRTVALVVDDLGLSHESSVRVRQALKKFVDEQIQPGDLVAVIRTGAGMGALQQFTTDKNQLLAAVERIRYNLSSRSSISTFAPIGGETLIKDGSIGASRDEVQKDPYVTGIRQPGRELDQFREELFSVGTLGALNFVVRGLRNLPGRKSVVLFSDGFKMYTQDPGNDRVRENLQRLIDLANRASVVFYSIDPRGLQTFGITAADNLSGPISTGNGGDPLNFGDASHREYLQEIERQVGTRRSEFYETQHGLSFLAEQTGGFLVKNNNDIGGAVRRVMNDQSGFYLIGYRPDEASLKRSDRNFRGLTVKVKRPGLRVRTRKGFFNFTDEETRRPVRRDAAQQLFAALTSPFGAGDVRLRMTAAFGYDHERKTHFTQSLVHIDARDLVFKPQPDGSRSVVVELMAVTFGDNGKVLDMDDRAYTVNVSEGDFQRAQTAGLVYTVTLPMKKPGAYQLRIAVRDAATGRVGAANQFINVPDIKKSGLTLSGVTLRGTHAATALKAAGGQSGVLTGAPLGGQSASGRGGVADADPHAGPAGRKLRRGMVLEYGYHIYNAQLDKGANRPQLVTQLRLFRDGRLVYEGKVRELDTSAQPDARRLTAGGSLLLGRDLPPGEYILQAVVFDRLAKEDRALATQWIDFDIVE